MNETLLFSILEVLGVIIFASEGLFVKEIELHPFINILLAYAVYAIISFVILSVKGEMNVSFLKKLAEPKFLLINLFNIIKTGGLFMAFKLIPVSFAIILKMMSPAFIMMADSILNGKPMHVLQIVGMLTSLLMIGLIYRSPIMKALKNVNAKFFLGVLGVLLYNIMNAYNVIRLPQYVTDKDPNEEVFLSTGTAFITLLTIVSGLFFTNRKFLGAINHFNIIKMIGVFTFTCYI
jgi:drug/metabolite transporter (DMT)-like permease